MCSSLGTIVNIRKYGIYPIKVKFSEGLYDIFNEESLKKMDDKITYDKIVRDKIIDIIKSQGKEVEYEKIDSRVLPYLCNKLHEESDELKKAVDEINAEQVKEELADLLEVILSIGDIVKFSFDDILSEMYKKREEKGRFTDGIILKSVENKYDKDSNNLF